MAQPDSQQGNRTVNMHRVYIKDASLEVPNAPGVFTQNGQPQIDVQINTSPRKLDDGNHEVTLSVNVTAKLEEKTVFLVEVQQSGLFEIVGFEGVELQRILGSYCPNALFPFAREAIASLIGRGGFPPVMLAPVNFDALFQQHQNELKNAQQEADQQPKH